MSTERLTQLFAKVASEMAVEAAPLASWAELAMLKAGGVPAHAAR